MMLGTFIHSPFRVSRLESDSSLSEAANFLYLLDGEKPSVEKESTLDMCYVLHADHGMNASTFSARVTIATLSDMVGLFIACDTTPSS